MPYTTILEQLPTAADVGFPTLSDIERVQGNYNFYLEELQHIQQQKIEALDNELKTGYRQIELDRSK